MIVGFIFSLFAAISLLLISINSGSGNGKEFILGFLFCLALELTTGFYAFSFADIKENPQPIDVYRGRTTLEISYRDSVAVDSVVVWKEE